MSEYTGRERVALAYQKQYADRVPTDLLGSMVALQHLGFSGPELGTDAQKHATAIIESWKMVHSDMVTVGVLSLPMAQAVGNECGFDDLGMLYAKTRILEEKSTLAKLTLPDPAKDDPLPVLLEACERVGSALAQETGVRGIVSLPWTVAMQMRDMERLIYDTVDDPEFVHAVMRFCTEYTKALGTLVLEAIGDKAIGLYASDPSAGCSVISPNIYREFVKPYHTEVVDYFKSRNTLITFHICGYLDPIMEDLVATGLDGMSIDEKSSLKKMFEVSGGKVVVLGNVPPIMFANGTKEEIEATVKECLETAASEKGFILAAGCGIPAQSPRENLEHFVAAAEKYGRHDVSERS